ncbi:hypothetical protein [Halodesulfurarchaeum sp.]|uniref:hypothetical protein n=1 Tax=Halodesulfurarchaeum sp. TaxID=1980530 RepID=UPI001BC6F898|nr:hypothetical protein [Halodesulfurarchaeum sp.]
MDRRPVLFATGTAVGTGLAVCLGDGVPIRPASGTDRPLAVDCADVSRPEPASPEATNAIQPIASPDPPSWPLDEAKVRAFVAAFDRAYRRNREIDAAEPYLVEYGFRLTGERVAELAVGGYLVRLEYVFSGTVAEGVAYDSATTGPVCHRLLGCNTCIHNRGWRSE